MTTMVASSLSISFIFYFCYALQTSSYIININNNTTKTDKFGIRELYLSKSAGEEWYMNMDNPNNDSRTDPQTILIKNNDTNLGDNSWKVQNTEVRYDIFTSSGYKPQLITTLNQTELSKKGYMQSQNDWKNVEMTGYFKINRFTNSDKNGPAHIELVARGGKNTDNNNLVNGLSKQCEATTYHSNIYETGKVKFEKDLMHTQGYTTNDIQIPNTTKEPLLGRWIGIKAVFYNLSDNNSVKLEQYIDDNSNNNWHKVLSYIDNGHWGGGTPNCGGSDTQVITWGGPIAIFRWDNIDDMDIKNFSIREIQSN
jgi:hypothetical protein